MDRLQPRKITRKRELRACTECRRRKLKCDCVQPCINCDRRDDAPSCVYLQTAKSSQDDNLSRVQTEARLGHLEQLVNELSQSRQSPTESQISTINDCSVQSNRGTLAPQFVQHGATHWSAMLEEIKSLRDNLDEQADIDIDHADHQGGTIGEDATGLLFSGGKYTSFQRVLSQFLPCRQEVDRLVGAYFRMKTVAAPFIHTTQFQRLYGIFWKDPSTSSPFWTSILFSILDIATKIVSREQKPSTNGSPMDNQHDVAAAHCLIVGNYFRPQRFAIEGLLLFAQARCLTSADIGPDTAILFGTLVRLATVAGYHRDPDGYQHKISAFEGEMRRRTWSLLMQLDMLVSFQLGLPSNIQYPTWDTRPPTNLSDSDFDEDTSQLPPARLDTDPTELLFYIAKHRLMAVFEKVIRHTLSATEKQSSELEAIDLELRKTQAELPVTFHPRPMADSIVDTPSIKVTRLCVNAIYQKCLCVLHRKYVAQGSWDSLQRCYTAASGLVGRFLEVYPEFEPGGQLETERWFMGSLTWNDFLLGCMTLCLTVCSTKHYTTYLAVVDIAASVQMLREAETVCDEHSNRSGDTKKVQRLIAATIKAFDGQNCANTFMIEDVPGIQAGLPDGQTMGPQADWLADPPLRSDIDWTSSEYPTFGADDTGWAYLGQFLNLPHEDLMAEVEYQTA